MERSIPIGIITRFPLSASVTRPLLGRRQDGRNLHPNAMGKDSTNSAFPRARTRTKSRPGQPIAFYTTDIVITEDMPGYVDPDEFWASSNPRNRTSCCTISSRAIRVGKPARAQIRGLLLREARPGPTREIPGHHLPPRRLVRRPLPLRRDGSPARMRDWGKHWYRACPSTPTSPTRA